MNNIGQDPDPFSFDFSGINDEYNLESDSISSVKRNSCKEDAIKEGLFFFEKTKVSLGKSVDFYDEGSYFNQKKITHLSKNKGLIESDTHGFVLIKIGKDGKYVIATKKGEEGLFRGKNANLHRVSESGRKRLEKLKSKNIVLIEMSDEQYAKVSSVASRIFSDISRQIKKDEEKKKLEKGSSHKLLDRLKKFPEGSLKKDITKWLRESDFSKHSRKSGDSPNEIQERGIEKDRKINDKKKKVNKISGEIKDMIKEKDGKREVRMEEYLEEEQG